MALAVLAVAVLGVETAPNSYGYIFFTGQCFKSPVPAICFQRVRR